MTSFYPIFLDSSTVLNNKQFSQAHGSSSLSSLSLSIKITETTPKTFAFASLGISIKSPAAFPSDALKSMTERRSHRFYLQGAARRFLPKHRVCNCLNRRIDKTLPVTVLRSIETGVATFGNVQRCGSVWACPVCSAKISEGRRIELSEGVKNHRATGGDVLLLTLTNSHHKGTVLKQLLESQKSALSLFFSGTRQARAIFNDMGRLGHIRSLEVTHGTNGWHPHYHVLLFIKKPLEPSLLSDIRHRLARLWQDCCVKQGLPAPTIANGIDLRDGTYADQYVGKWGVEHEMTKSHLKKGKKDSRTPWDLLNAAAGGCDSSKNLWIGFVSAMHGRRQLAWSRGLRALLGLELEQTDEALAVENKLKHETVIKMSLIEWQSVVFQDMRHELLCLVEQDLILEAIDLIMVCCELTTTVWNTPPPPS